MDQNGKGVAFRNKNIQSDEFYKFEELETKTFDEIAIDLWDRQRRKKSGFRTDVDSSELAAARQSVKFSWMPPNSTGYQPINGARGVLEFVHEMGPRQIFYFFEPIGGASVEVFARHAREIADQPRHYGIWIFGTTQDNAPQIEKFIIDRFQRVVQVIIRPVPGYPEAPPRVITRPPIHDQCFYNGGELGWARARETGRLIWSEHASSSNPLAVLIDELRRKYHVF